MFAGASLAITHAVNKFLLPALASKVVETVADTKVGNVIRGADAVASSVFGSNVDNVKQYSSTNPPPYPVTSVNGQQGEVTVVKIVVSKETPNNMNDGDLWYKILS